MNGVVLFLRYLFVVALANCAAARFYPHEWEQTALGLFAALVMVILDLLADRFEDLA